MSHKLFDMLHLLDAARVYYTLSRHRPESVMITVTMIGERMEIDVFEDGHIEYSRFFGSEDVESDIEYLEDFIRRLGAENLT